MPLEGVFIEPPQPPSSSSPDLSLNISLPNTSSLSSSSIRTDSPLKPISSQQQSYTYLSLTNPSTTFATSLPQETSSQNPFPYQLLNHNIINRHNLNHLNNQQDCLRPIKGIPVYHNHNFPFAPNLDNSSIDKDPKMFFNPSSSNPSSPYFVANGGHMPFLNPGLNTPSSSGYRLPRFTGLSSSYPQQHHHHNQYGGGDVASHEMISHGLMRSRFLPKLPSKRSMRAPRMRWTSTLHSRFVHAVELLGGHESI